MIEARKEEQELVEQLIQEELKSNSAYDRGLTKQWIESKVLPLIRSHTDALIGAAVEACAKQADEWHIYVRHPDGCEHNQDLSALGEHIRSLAPEAAREELERVKLESRIDEWRDAVVYFLSSDLHGNDIEKIKSYVKSHSADLKRQRAELEKPVKEGRDG